MKQKIIEISYLLLIALTIGATFTLGILVAPVIFNMSDLIISNVSKFENGQIMSEIFNRYNYLLNLSAFFITIVEIREYLRFNRDKIVLLSAFFSVTTALLFTLYYTPFIIQAQQIGVSATETSAFEGMHKGSVIDFKILLISITVLFVRKIYLLNRGEA